ncbi:hypothetical protein [Neobacillus cucumis]|uniref:hypothetical protein n=1 Tax=Neobacillus cucumis TaxID=1740721 RepID=UPI002E1DEE19|nr:hypothetical protein [Neobacillus cucumis]
MTIGSCKSSWPTGCSFPNFQISRLNGIGIISSVIGVGKFLLMAKIETVKEKHTESEIAQHIASRILVDDEITEFREFVAQGYSEVFKEDKRKLRAYYQNQIRDLALISLILKAIYLFISYAKRLQPTIIKRIMTLLPLHHGLT